MANVEIFILNYNGNSFLEGCFSALREMKKEDNVVNVNLIDNNSSISPEAILVNFPEVNYIPLEINSGFSTGNNWGVWTRLKQLKEKNAPEPDYIIFLNNDTKVEKNWLLEALKTLASDSSIGILGSKAIFMDKFVKITFRTKSTLKFEVLSCENIPENRRIKFKGMTRTKNQYVLSDLSELFLPVEDEEKDIFLSASLINDEGEDVEFSYQINDQVTYSIQQKNSGKLDFHFKQKDFKRVIQNAGSFITKDWSGGDIGFLEFDNGQYDKTEERQAICGVSMFVRTDLFKQLNGFDQMYFAYYEDTDLSLRARLLGYRCVYQPKSQLFHLHCGSSTEYSDYFNMNVTWSYFLFVSRYANFSFWFRILARYFKKACLELGRFCQDRKLTDKYHLRTIGRCLKIPLYFIKNRIKNVFMNNSSLQERSNG